MNSSWKKLNPLLRLAAISGVEAAIRLHVSRGDDLNARDGHGATPLILAVIKRRTGAVRLLLEAGANPTIADLSGMDALAYAVKGGCHEIITILTEALAHFAVSEPAGEYALEAPKQEESPPIVESTLTSDLPASIETSLHDTSSNDDALPALTVECAQILIEPVDETVTEVIEANPREILFIEDEPLSNFFVDEWEAEDVVSVPEGDEAVAEATKRVHESIRRHRIVDRDEDWEDTDLYLPVRAAPLVREEETGAVRRLLLAALREGVVSESALIDACLNLDGSRNEEAEGLIALVVGDLGATVVERTMIVEPLLIEPSLDEEFLLMDALEFAEELASGRNEPSRLYLKEIKGDLLDAEEEIALGREMEESGRAALSALSVWPDGLSAVFDAANRVARGEADADLFSVGPEPIPNDDASSRALCMSGDEDGEVELGESANFFVKSIAAVEAAIGQPDKVFKALEEARLTRGFLMDLAKQAGRDETGSEFVKALRNQAAARERMIKCNLRLALYIARKHMRSQVPLDDLVQEANIGLIKAVERFDWRRGFRFSTYATWWIRQQVSRFIIDAGRVVRSPVHVHESARKVVLERDAEEFRLGRPETELETALRLGMSPTKVRLLLSTFDDIASLDELDYETGLPKADLLVDDCAIDPTDAAEGESLRSTLSRILEKLDDRSREVILLRFGMKSEGDEALTLEEVGLRFDVTRERIRQIESKALNKLSHRSKRDVLWPFMGEKFNPNRSSSQDCVKSASSPAVDGAASADNEPDIKIFIPPSSRGNHLGLQSD